MKNTENNDFIDAFLFLQKMLKVGLANINLNL